LRSLAPRAKRDRGESGNSPPADESDVGDGICGHHGGGCGAAIGEGHRTAGAGGTGLVGAGRGRLPPACAPFPGSGGGPEFESRGSERPHTADSACRFWAYTTHGRPGGTWPTLGRSRSRDHVPGSLQPRRRSDETGCGPREVAGRSVGDPKEPLSTLRPATSRHNEKLV